jgi:hypothetical protein
MWLRHKSDLVALGGPLSVSSKLKGRSIRGLFVLATSDDAHCKKSGQIGTKAYLFSVRIGSAWRTAPDCLYEGQRVRLLLAKSGPLNAIDQGPL